MNDLVHRLHWHSKCHVSWSSYEMEVTMSASAISIVVLVVVMLFYGIAETVVRFREARLRGRGDD